MADGEVTIDAVLGTDRFERQIAKLKKDTEKVEQKKIIVQAELQSNLKDLEEQRKKVQDLTAAQARLNELRTQQKTSSITAEQFSEIQNIEAQYGSLTKLGNEIQKNTQKQTHMELKVEQTKARIEEMTNKAEEYQSKINTLS